VLPANIIVVPNTPLVNVFNATNIDNQIVEKYKSDFTVFYAGGIDSLRGLSTVLAAINILKGRIPRIKFVVAGRIVKPYDFLAEIRHYDVEKQVDYLGWVDVSQIPSYVFASSVCVHVPPATHDEVNMSISTKIYQYMALRKPIIVGQAKLMKKLVEESGVGVSIVESDPDDLAKKLLHYFNHPEVLDEIIANYDSIAEKYFWEGTVKPLILAYEKFEQSK
jgi:glycosyltransferase involved in cell wall biosynthesis